MDIEGTYSFDVPGPFIWTTHIIIGILLAYIGYNILNKQFVNPNLGLLLVILGVLAALYHTHIWYLNKAKDEPQKGSSEVPQTFFT